jgi:predicted nucleic acid-binding Zn ribbon protein
MKINTIYLLAREAEVGSLIECPVCNKFFSKMDKEQYFCCLDCQYRFLRLFIDEEHERKIKSLSIRYDLNGRKNVGDIIHCCVCGKEIVKTVANKRFCSSECKNRFHNITNTNRIIRLEYYKELNKLF